MRKALDEVHRLYRRDLVVYQPPQSHGLRSGDEGTRTRRWISRS